MKKIGLSEKQWLAARAAILPVVTLLPFAVKHHSGCAAPKTIDDLACYTTPALSPSLKTLSVFFMLLLIAGLVVSLYRFRLAQPARARKFAHRQFGLTLLVVVATTVVYSAMYFYSQRRGMFDATVASDGTTLQDVWLPVFGYGLSPYIYGLAAGIFLLTPAYQLQQAEQGTGKGVGSKLKAVHRGTVARRRKAGKKPAAKPRQTASRSAKK